MEKFSIGDEDSDGRKINPLFLESLPKLMMKKGTLVEYHSSHLFKAVVFKERKGISGLFLQSQKQAKRLLGFEDEYIYGYEKKRDGYIVTEVWPLRRLFKLEIKKENPESMSLFFINKTLRPADSVKVKPIKVENSAYFLQMLKNQLSLCDIDLEI